MAAFILGSAAITAPPLSAPTASSAEGLTVTRWAHKPARLARMDRLCALALVAADAALVAAGRSPTDAAWRPDRVGIVLGTAYGCHAINETYYRGYLAAGVEGASPRDFAYTLPSSPVGEITIHHQIHGPASTTVGGLPAAIDAVAEALRHLDAGRAELMLVAAADVSTPLLARMGADATTDAAAALVLAPTGEGPRLVATASRFRAGDPHAAAREVIERLGSVELVYAPASLRAQLGGSTQALPEAAHAAAPLLALRDAIGRGARSAIVVAVDASGQAAALRLDA